jgi:hypothetical protein
MIFYPAVHLNPRIAPVRVHLAGAPTCAGAISSVHQQQHVVEVFIPTGLLLLFRPTQLLAIASDWHRRYGRDEDGKGGCRIDIREHMSSGWRGGP